MQGNIRSMTVPSFKKTNEIVFVDIETMEAYSYKIESTQDESKDVNMDE